MYIVKTYNRDTRTKKADNTKTTIPMNNNLLTERLVYNGTNPTDTHIHATGYTPGTYREATCETFTQLLGWIDKSEKLLLRIHGFRNTGCIKEICEHFGIDFLTIQDILNVEHPTKIEEHDNYNIVVTNIFAEGKRSCIRLVLGSDYVLSFTDGESPFFNGVAKGIKENTLKIRERTTDYLFSVMMNEVVSNYVACAMSIGDALDDLQEQLMAANDNRSSGAELQKQRMRYTELKRTVLPMKDQYTRLLRSDTTLIRKTNRPYFNDVNDHLFNAAQLTEECRDTISSLTDLYISNNNLRMNDIMKRLTIVSTIFIPLTFLVGVWGMNFKNMPETEWKYGYIAAWCVIVTVGCLSYFFFRSNKWK